MAMGDLSVDDALAQFLNPIRDLAQNFEINLGELLQNYLARIDSANIQEALDAVNFAEAAIVLQQSASIYGKKVDYLWQVVMQVLDSFQKKKKQEEAQKKGKAGETDLAYQSPDFCEIDDDELFGNNVQINISPDYVPNTIKFLPKYNPQLEMKVAAEKKLPLLGLQNNVIGNKYDFRVNKYLSIEGMLIDEQELKIMDSAPDTNCDRITSVDQQCDTLQGVSEIYNVENNDLHVADIDPGASNIECEDAPENFESDPVPNLETSVEKIVEHRERRSANRRKTDKIVTLDLDPWKPWPADKHVPNKKFVKAITYKIPPELLNSRADQNKKKVPSIFQFFQEKNAQKVQKKMGYLGDVEFYGCEKNADTPPPPEEVTAMWDELAKLLADDGMEDNVSEDDADSDKIRNDDEVSEDSFTENLAPEECEVDVPPLSKIDEFPTTSLSEALGKHLQLEIPIEDNSTYEEYSREAFSVAALLVKPSPGLTAKVNEWHSSIRPKLQAANERGSFDIHAYGTRIIEKLQPFSSKFVSFKDVTEFEKSEDVPRTFLATLMLANSGNVEIGKMDDTHLAMDCMSVSLLSSTRHHKVFEEHASPSREGEGADL